MTFSASRPRPRFGRIALILSLAVVAVFAITSRAQAATVQIGPYIYGTTEEFCKLDLTPETATLPTGNQHTVTATVSSTGIDRLPRAARDATYLDVVSACVRGDIESLIDVGVNFVVTSGPNAGKTGVGALDASGKAYFSYQGMVAGTDTIEASLVLPDICWAFDVVEEEGVRPRAAGDLVPLPCEELLDDLPEIDLPLPESNQLCNPYNTSIQLPPQPECPTTTLKDTATVTWTETQVTVAATPDPTVSISSRKRCVARTFKISPTYSNGTVKTSTLFIDSRKVSTKTDTSPFTVNAKRYKAGRHNVEVVTVFTNGKAASKFGLFSRCKVRTAARKVAPRFTG